MSEVEATRFRMSCCRSAAVCTLVTGDDADAPSDSLRHDGSALPIAVADRAALSMSKFQGRSFSSSGGDGGSDDSMRHSGATAGIGLGLPQAKQVSSVEACAAVSLSLSPCCCHRVVGDTSADARSVPMLCCRTMPPSLGCDVMLHHATVAWAVM